jgi:hypothetical protein
MGGDRVKPGRIIFWLRGLLATWLLAPLVAFAAPDPSGLCDRAAAMAAEESGVPIDILLAISRVETGRSQDGVLSPWPWTINADGAGAFYDNKEEAVAAATAHLTDGTGTFDTGCFQINYSYHNQEFTDLDDMFDPLSNARYAAKFLNQLYAEMGNWADAVAAYHSRTPDKAEAYLDQVKSVIEGPEVAQAAAEPVPRINAFPLLQAGDPGMFGSIVPQTGGLQPLMGAVAPLIGG